jgi:Ca2+:H+ antiporter
LVYLIFAMTLYLLPPKSSGESATPHKTTERSMQRGDDVGKFASMAIAPRQISCSPSRRDQFSARPA